MRALLCFSLLTVLTGCGVNRAVVDPWSYAPASGRVKWQEGGDNGKAVPEENQPLTLAETLDIALRNNMSTRSSWAAARAAAARFASSQAALMPRIDGEINLERAASTCGNGTSGSDTTYGPRITLVYTLFDFGSRKATTDAAKYALDYAGWSHNRTIESVVNQITQDYYDLSYQKELENALADALLMSETAVDAAKLEFEKGIRGLSDKLQAESDYFQKKSALSAQKVAVKMAFATLANDMGLPASTEFSIEGLDYGLDPLAAAADMGQLIELALEKRTDLKAMEAALQSREQALTAARRSMLPTLGLSASAGRTFFDIHDRSRAGNDYAIGLKLSMPLFAGFSYRNAVKLAEANRESAYIDFESKRLAVIKEMTTAQFGADSASQQVVDAKNFYEAAAKQYQVALEQYKHGLSTILDLLTAESQLANARSTRAAAIKNWYLSFANLAYASGALEEGLYTGNPL